MYSFLLAIGTLVWGGAGAQNAMHICAAQSANFLAFAGQQIVAHQDQHLLALRTEADGLVLVPLYLEQAPTQSVSSEQIIAAATTSDPVDVEATGPSISVLPSPVVRPRVTATPRPIVPVAPSPVVIASAPVAPVTVAPAPVVVPPVVAPPVAAPVATALPTPPAVAPAPTRAPAAPRVGGPVMAAVNSQNIGTYYFSAPKLGLANVPVNPIMDASADVAYRNLPGLGQILCPPATVGCKTVLFGHSSNYSWVKSQYNEVFRYLNQLDPGDEISIDFQGQHLRYRVTKEEIVGPETASIVTNYGREELVLFTCWPYLSSRERYIVYLDRIF